MDATGSGLNHLTLPCVVATIIIHLTLYKLTWQSPSFHRPTLCSMVLPLRYCFAKTQSVFFVYHVSKKFMIYFVLSTHGAKFERRVSLVQRSP